MNVLLVIAFMFSVGSILGWGIEVIFRNFIKPTRTRGVWVNPGYCMGPYLPIYGIGLTVMFIIAYTQSVGMVDTSLKSYIILFVSIALTMTIIEFIGGLILLKLFNLRLWDYRGKWGNIQGLICPQFSLIWAIIGALYYFLIHPIAIDWLVWLSENLAFSFFIGLFYGVFVIDLLYSSYKAYIIRQYGNEHDIVVKYEELKALVQEHRLKQEEKVRIFNQTLEKNSFLDTLKEHTQSHELKSKKTKVKIT